MDFRWTSKWAARLAVPVCAIVFIAACNFPVRTDGTGLPLTAEPAARATDTPSAGTAVKSAAQNSTEDVAPTGTPTRTAMIVHTSTPGTPGAVEWYVTDYSSKSTAAEKRAPGGDSYTWNLYERPFLAEGMEYLPGIDIMRADMIKSGSWFYVTIRLQEAPVADARYAVEVDADIDGRGDYLIGASTPSGKEWTTDGVQVWEDSNGDVGGPVPVKSDPPGSRDGYDELAFDQGIGEDPDAAWARISPTEPKHVQLAFKTATIGGDVEFLWGVWADAGSKRPGWLDYNDHFTFAEAGSPLKGNAEYPLKALEALDNTCRMAYGFTLLGTEPGACYIAVPSATPSVTPTLTQTSNVIFKPPQTEVGFPFIVTSVEIIDVRAERIGSTCGFTVYSTAKVTANKAGIAMMYWQIVHNDVLHNTAAFPVTIGSSGSAMQTNQMVVQQGDRLQFAAIITSPNAINSGAVSFVVPTVSCD